MSDLDREQFPWILLLGALLSNQEARDEAFRVIEPHEVPEPLRGIWNAVKEKRGRDLWMELDAKGIAKRGEKVISCVIQNLQERLLAKYCRETVSRVEFAKGVGPEQLATLLETMSTKIRARQAEIEKVMLKPEGLPKQESRV